MRIAGWMVLWVGFGLPVWAEQGLFSPAAQVNDRVVTQYEVAQRALFLKLLRTPGDLQAEALKLLIEDRLRLETADRLKLKLTEEQIAAGMAEFAGRAQLSTEEFIKALGEAGVEPPTFVDFVSAGLVWRDVVRAKFGPRATVSEADIDRAMTLTAQPATVRVLLSELILAAPPEQAAEAEAFAADLSGSIRGEAAFAAAARDYSASSTAERGGVLDWMPLANLPPQIGAMLLTLRPGEVSPPVVIPNAVALFLVRAIEAGREAAGPVTVDYAAFLIPGGHSAGALAKAAQVRAQVDVCDDLYGLAKGLPAERLLRESGLMTAVPRDVGLELAKLDEGESSVALERGGALLFLMLCSRGVSPLPDMAAVPPKGAAVGVADAVDIPEADRVAAAREAVRTRLINDKLNGFSAAYLAELLANAHIVMP